MQLENYTPHGVTLCGKTYPSVGVVRCSYVTTQIGTIDGIPVNRKEFTDVVGLPLPKPHTAFIVSKIVAEACKGFRDDLYIVDDVIRDENGRVLGARALSKL